MEGRLLKKATHPLLPFLWRERHVKLTNNGMIEVYDSPEGEPRGKQHKLVVIGVADIEDSITARMHRFDVKLAESGSSESTETLSFCANSKEDKLKWLDSLRSSRLFIEKANASYELGVAKMKQILPEFSENGLQIHEELKAPLSADQDAVLSSAAGYFQDALKVYYKHIPSHFGLGVAGCSRGDWEAAIARFGCAFNIDPQLPGLRENLANAHFCQAMLAVKQMETNLKTDRKTKNHAAATTAADDDGNNLSALAEQHFAAAATVLPSSASYHLHLADVRLVRGDLAGAEAAYRRAIREAERAEITASGGTKGTADGTVPAKGAAVTVLPAVSPRAHVALGKILLKQESAADTNYDAAIETMRSALQVDPEYVPAHKLLGEILAKAPLTSGSGDGKLGNLKHAAESFLSAIKFCTLQNEHRSKHGSNHQQEETPSKDEYWTGIVSGCWNDLGNLYSRHSLALAETTEWQRARLEEEEEGTMTKKKRKKAKKEQKKSDGELDDSELASLIPNPDSDVFDVPLMKQAVAAFYSSLAVEKSADTYYNLAQTLAVRFGEGRGSTSLRTAIEGFVSLDPAYEKKIRMDPTHPLTFFFQDRDRGIHIVDYQGVISHVNSRADLARAGRSRDIQFCELLFQRKSEFGSRKATYRVRRVVVITKDMLLTYKLKPMKKQSSRSLLSKRAKLKKNPVATPSKSIPLRNFYKLYVSISGRSALLRTKTGRTLTFVGEFVDVFVRTFEALNPNVKKLTAHIMKTSESGLEDPHANTARNSESVGNEEENRDRSESLQLEELEKQLGIDAVLSDNKDIGSDEEWAADSL